MMKNYYQRYSTIQGSNTSFKQIYLPEKGTRTQVMPTTSERYPNNLGFGQ